MQDTKLYQQILGLAEPWKVTQVELKVDQQRVDIFVEHGAEASFACPTCFKACGLYDHAEERTWRHLDTCQFQTYLHARVPRVNCPEHGVVNAQVPWGSKSSRFTLLMERLIIQLLEACQNIQSVCRLVKISWGAAAGVMQRAVVRGQARKAPRLIRYVGVDEKSFRKRHHYITVVSDLERGAVEYVAEHRTTESLAGYYRQLNDEQRRGIEAVAMDMHRGYERATREHVPQGEEKIVFDRFHIMKNINQALDRIRQSENWELSRRQDDTLARTRHLRRLWDQPDVAAARAFFGHWREWVRRSKLTPMIHLARTLELKLEQIVSYCRHRITSAGCEGLNSKITSVKVRAAGFRNLERFKTAILFYCGKLELYP